MPGLGRCLAHSAEMWPDPLVPEGTWAWVPCTEHCGGLKDEDERLSQALRNWGLDG